MTEPESFVLPEGDREMIDVAVVSVCDPYGVGDSFAATLKVVAPFPLGAMLLSKSIEANMCASKSVGQPKVSLLATHPRVNVYRADFLVIDDPAKTLAHQRPAWCVFKIHRINLAGQLVEAEPNEDSNED